jgi:predicted proteasome-type protease
MAYELARGTPIIDRDITPPRGMSAAIQRVLESFDSTMRSNLSVGMPNDLACLERDALKLGVRRRFDPGDLTSRRSASNGASRCRGFARFAPQSARRRTTPPSR